MVPGRRYSDFNDVGSGWKRGPVVTAPVPREQVGPLHQKAPRYGAYNMCMQVTDLHASQSWTFFYRYVNAYQCPAAQFGVIRVEGAWGQICGSLPGIRIRSVGCTRTGIGSAFNETRRCTTGERGRRPRGEAVPCLQSDQGASFTRCYGSMVVLGRIASVSKHGVIPCMERDSSPGVHEAKRLPHG